MHRSPRIERRYRMLSSLRTRAATVPQEIAKGSKHIKQLADRPVGCKWSPLLMSDTDALMHRVWGVKTAYLLETYPHSNGRFSVNGDISVC